MSRPQVYAKLPEFKYHAFDYNTIKYTNIPFHGPKKPEKEEEKPPSEEKPGAADVDLDTTTGKTMKIRYCSSTG